MSSDVIANVADDVATRTLTFLKTATKDRFTALRARLPLEDQEIIVLRIDRDLPWSEIAMILGDAGDDDASTKRRSAALRKRYERIKAEIRTLAQSEGLLPKDS